MMISMIVKIAMMMMMMMDMHTDRSQGTSADTGESVEKVCREGMVTRSSSTTRWMRKELSSKPPSGDVSIVIFIYEAVVRNQIFLTPTILL
jgi:hypothetical protein